MGDSNSAKKADTTAFRILPDLKNKFRSKLFQEVIHGCMVEHLSDFVYSEEGAEEKTSLLADVVRNKIIELNLPNYKYAVHVVIGEQRGEAVKVAARCLWDSDSDGHAFDNFTGDTFFCNIAVFGLYHY